MKSLHDTHKYREFILSNCNKACLNSFTVSDIRPSEKKCLNTCFAKSARFLLFTSVLINTEEEQIS